MKQKEEVPFLRQLEEETRAWEQEGLLGPGQRERILDRYGTVNGAEVQVGPGRLITTISILGAILIGTGIILFIASNWSYIPNWLRLAIIFAALLSSYWTGFRLRYDRGTYPRTGGAVILLGALVFGAGIFLVAQMYHISAHYPNGFLMWGLGVLPLAYLLKFRSLLALALADLLLWLGMEIRFWLSDAHDVWGMQTVTLFLMAGALLWGTGLAHRGSSRLKALAEPYIVIGSLVTFSGCFILTFDVYRHQLGSPSLIPFYVVIAILFLSSLAVRVYARTDEKLWEAEILALMAAMGASLYLALMYRWGGGEGHFYLILVNLLFATGVIGIITLGYFRHYPLYVNIGLAFFILDAAARYVDFFWKMLPRSIFFIIGGAVLLGGGAVLERKRRRILARFDREEAV